MSKKTHAEIIDEIRLKCARAYWSEDSLHPNGDIPEIKCLEPHKLATQLESAHKREMDALKQRCTELSAEVAAKDEVIKRLNDAIAEDQRRKMATAEKSSAVGDCANAATSGYGAHAEVKGKDAIAAVLGHRCKARGALGCWLVLTERDDDGHILGVQAVKVDGESIKADTWYELRGGNVVEAKEED